jgi:gas vesicle protein
METRKVSPQVSEDNKNDFLTGMVTGMPVATATAQTKPIERNCGSDSLYPECVCAGDDAKEGFTPPCASSGACDEAKHYRCVPHEPTELIKAYLDKYPSDIKATGTECEQKGGYCISSGDSCKSAFAETGFACKTSSEKCCVKSVDKSDFLDIVMKLEGIRVRMDTLERQSNALADYYKSTGDTGRANKFSDVAGMFNNGKGMIDDIIAKIRANINNPDAIRDEIKKDINDLQDHINAILERMVS